MLLWGSDACSLGLYHGGHLVVADVGTLRDDRYQAYLVEHVKAVQVILVKYDLQILTVLLQIDSLEFSGLIVCADVIVKREVPQSLKGDVCIVRGEEVGLGPAWGEVWRVCV